MLKEERHKKILDLLQAQTYLSISDIAKKFGISEMTARRDVSELDSNKKLIKLFGGAQKIEKISVERSTQEKISSHVEEKKYIGKIMNYLIPENATIFVGAGTTIYHALSEITKKKLFVITNSLLAFNYLKEMTDYRIMLTGGEFYPTTEEFVGDIAAKTFDTLNIDIAFITTNGILGNDITTSHIAEGNVQLAARKKSKVTCVVVDSSKLGISDIYTFCSLSDIDYLITDNKISNKFAQDYQKYITILSEGS